MSQKILGLDVGTNSLGWALLEGKDGRPEKVVDVGVRIFNEAIDSKNKTPKNAQRRRARLARRVLQRRARRKRKMLSLLVRQGLLPQESLSSTKPEEILTPIGDPYELRARALDDKLSKHELGRVFFHLAQRRGFLSNKKTLLGDMADDPDAREVLQLDDRPDSQGSSDEEEKDKEEREFKKHISELRNKMKVSGARTLGEYLYEHCGNLTKRNRLHAGGFLRTDRRMYEEEFHEIVKAQQGFGATLPQETVDTLRDIIFFQRPLKFRSDRVGKCTLEPEKNRVRIGRLEAQRFRYLQDINHLGYRDIDGSEQSVGDEGRAQLKELFETVEGPTFARVRQTLGLDRGIEFNLEGYGTKKLKGNTTACRIREVYPEWDELDDRQQERLVEDLITIQKKSVLKKRLMSHWRLSREEAVKLCLIEFESGHSNHSLKAIRRMLPFLEEGAIYSEARESAGYGYEQPQQGSWETLEAPPPIPNPIVSRGLSELRRVVNAVIAEYGKPDIVRIEMARDLEMNTKKYKRYQKQLVANQKANKKAEEEYSQVAKANPHLQLRDRASGDDQVRYRLWEDQNRQCVYSGNQIGSHQLFSPEVEIDHIIPYSQSFDNSYMNKVVCLASENRHKGQRTPVDAFAGNIERWQQIEGAIGNWPKSLASKKNRFYLTAAQVEERGFASSQLNDTRYISKVALEYVRQLGVEVSSTKGPIVALLRRQWRLNRILSVGDEKNRKDHRHHAIDATVIASIDRGFHQRLVHSAQEAEQQRGEFTTRRLCLDTPYPGWRDEIVDKLTRVVVSHVPQRKVFGALHEDTGLGFKEGIGLVTRKPLDGSITPKQVKNIVDSTVRDQVEQHLAQYNGSAKDAFAEGVDVWHKDGGTPIRRVRVAQSKTTLRKIEHGKDSKFGVKNKDGSVFKWMTYGNTHHVEILQSKKDAGKIKGEFVTMMEAAKRVRRKGSRSLIRINHGEEWQLLMTLHINDLVSAKVNGRRQVYRVQKLNRPLNSITLRLHTAATLDNKDEGIDLRINQDHFEKHEPELLRVNAIGKLLS